MTIALSNTDSLSPPPAPAGHIAAAQVLVAKPGQPGLLFSEAIGQLAGLIDQVEASLEASRSEIGLADTPAEADASPAGEAGAVAVAIEGKTENMPAAMSSLPITFGMMFGGLLAPALSDTPATESGGLDGAVTSDGSSRLPQAGGLAIRMASLAGAMAMPRPVTEEGAVPTRHPVHEADGGDVAGVLPGSAAPRKPAVDGITAAAVGNSAAFTSDAVPSVAASAAQTVLPVADGAASPAVKLPAGTPEQWRRPLLEALGERIQVEIAKRSEHAVIRLDPPMMGHVEIVIRHEAGSLQIQLSASNSEVLRQLQNISDSLRQDLGQRQYTDISVQIFAGASDSDGRRRADALPEEDPPGLALAEADADQASSRFVLAPDRD